MELWHGSQKIIETPQLGLGKVHNDYGQGFYCREPRPCKGMGMLA
ncbi:MAG: DUF3990 domain-containing protein [Collinsella sp.]